jgi:hypothetical protein
LNIRGENTNQTVQDPIANPQPVVLRHFAFDNGLQISYLLRTGNHTPLSTYDPINGVITETKNWSQSNGNAQCPNPDTTDETYDASSRHTGVSVISTDDPSVCSQTQGSITTSYDAENHAYLTSSATLDLTTRLWGGAASSASLGWGANGHPALVSATFSGATPPTTTTSLHYDGDILLFGSDASGNLAFVRSELFGEYAAAGGTGYRVTDRDFAELAVTSHNQNGFDGVSYLNGEYRTPKRSVPVDLIDYGGGNMSTAAFSPGPFEYIHPDGFETLFGTIQGTRISDPYNATWTTPDAYAGNVHDPMTQKPFMWNGNNPYQYSDPTGYEIGNIWRGWEGDVRPGDSRDADWLFSQLIDAAGMALAAEIPMLRGGFGSAASSAARGAARGGLAQSAKSGLLLSKSLASEAQVANALRGLGGRVVAGGGSKSVLRDAGRLAKQYGGKESDWAKMSSETWRASDGTGVETHWYQNISTGQVEEVKSKLIPPKAK